MSVCVYALATRGARTSAVRGIDGEKLRAIAVGRLDVIVGDVGRRPRPTDASLLRYDRILTRLWAQNRALLPVRFGTVVRHPSEVDLMLGQAPDALGEQLASVRDRAQMTILVLRSPRPRNRLSRQSPKSGTEYLRAAQAARDVPGLAPLRAVLGRWVRGERVETRGAIASVYHLIPRGAVGPYRAAAVRAGKDAGIPLRVLGPRPPYAFADPVAIQLMRHGEAAH
jgi:Gas vesicle synthesis protein GvpL/GvpF